MKDIENIDSEFNACMHRDYCRELKAKSSRSPGCSKATAQELADALDDIWMCANSGYSLPDLKAKIAMYVEGDSSLTKGF